jgi:hypothetical protein
MSACDVAADQLKCVRVLSTILADGTLTMPGTWSIHTYPGYEPALTPTLEGFFHAHPAPAVAELRAVLDVYAERFGLVVEEKPHGNGGMVGLHATGMWSGVDLKIWGPAHPEAGAR